MKIKIEAAGLELHNVITGETVNGFDLSVFPDGALFTPSEVTDRAGIRNIERINDELFVTLGQCGLPYKEGNDWRGTGEWMDAADYDPDKCYIVATSAPEGAEYVRRENGWTVTMPQTEEPTT